MLPVDALGPDGEYRTSRRQIVTDTRGVPVVDLAAVPRLYITRSIAAQRRRAPLPAGQRAEALTRAAEVFAGETIAGLSYADYVELTCRIAGLPLAVARAGADVVAESLATAVDAVRAAQPAGSTLDWRDQPSGAVWARRGDVLAVHAPGNAPGVHGLWPQALALGYRVAVRPSRREPLTAHRVVTALRRAGFRDADAAYLPTDHVGADDVVRAADLALVYGGQDVADRYAADPSVFVNGPGRTKILITAEQDWREHLDVVVDSIAALGGMACVNATAVLYEGDAAPLADAIAERLADMPALPCTDPRAVLPTVPTGQAHALAAVLAGSAVGSTPILGADQVVADLGDGFAALRPAVHLLSGPTSALAVELPFPCVWVSPWSRADGIAPLRNTLLLTAITSDHDLLDRLLGEPTVTNLYRGDVATHYGAPNIPHDGFLADFLMRNKGFVAG
ncbi:aldehyde dehydrogenase family protein [Mycolicibacterium arenosum]|uniref:Aldehyde dehydrogenase family protein n=1 Tax=Mycolicibacterium arenosum TaxID=2952157 RepID=A0ABT1LWB4_9MYCO|nr:aldehyde dehydrogenase family protein [Mycolicibacterium sp. CAU 1645]MCP9270772.1 aldehyde dehydrogenase family protein [Mycolicibacterium sp. CAU 1645]